MTVTVIRLMPAGTVVLSTESHAVVGDHDVAEAPTEPSVANNAPESTVDANRADTRSGLNEQQR
jgi:hypothetical protein